MRARPTPRNWVSGELAPWLDGLPGELINHGALTLENFVVKKQGAIQRRPGSFYVAEVKNSLSQTILIQCEIDSDNIYVLEMGNAYCRFYKNHAQVSLTAAAYEVTTPYSTADLTDLRWCYSSEEHSLYFTHPNYALRKITFFSTTSWSMTMPLLHNEHPIILCRGGGRTWATYDFSEYIEQEIDNVGAIAYMQDGAYGKNTYVFGGDDTWANGFPYVISSDDLSGWQGIQVSTNTGTIASVTYGSNKFILGGGFFVPSHSLFYSGDGIVWNILTSSTTLPHNIRVKYDKTTETFFAIGYGATIAAGYKYCSISKDGILWTSYRAIMPTSGTIADFDISDTGQVICVGSNAGTTATAWIASSTTSEFFSIGIAMSINFYGCVWGNPKSDGLWTASARTTLLTGVIYTSPTGTVWSLSTMTNLSATDFVQSYYKWAGDRYIGTTYSGKIVQSFSGSTWTVAYDTKLSPFSGINAGAFAIISDLDDEALMENAEYFRYAAMNDKRFILAGSSNHPSRIKGSRVGYYTDFGVREWADSPWEYDITADKNIDIKWIMGGMDGIVVGTRTAEGILYGSQEEGITPATAHFEWMSTFGSDNIQPIRIHDTIIFTQRGGEIVRGYVPSAGADAWKSPDLTAFADHIATGGVNEIDHQDDPQTVAHFVRSDGYGLGLTFEGTTRAWWRTKMGATASGMGQIESIAVIPTSGAEDEIWAVVKWTVGGTVKRYIVYFDAYNFGTKNHAHFLDCGYENSAAASATVYANACPGLAGETVTALINGNRVESGITVGTAGTVSITATDATHVHFGLPYTSYAQTMRLDHNSAWGSGLGLSKRLGNLNVWVHNSIGGKFGPTSSVTEAVTYTTLTDLTTDCLSINYPGQWDRDGYIWCIQSDPLPLTVVAVAPDMEMGDR